jgi:hypothetical protein
MVWAILATDPAHDTYSFAGIGNIIRVDGIDFFEYRQEPIWTPEVWQALVVVGAALSVPILAKMSAGFIDLLAALRERKPLSPVVGFYLVGALIFVVSLAFLGDLFDRYVLGFTPFVMVYVLRGAAAWGRVAWSYSAAAFLVLLSFTLLAKADFIDHNAARWEAARWLAARAPLPVQMGYDWNNWAQQHSTQRYQVADLPVENFRTDAGFSYLSRLSGFTRRTVLAQSSAGSPPLREPAPSPTPSP